MQITVLQNRNYAEFQEFLLNQEHSLLFTTPAYKTLLEKNLNCDSTYLLHRKADAISGCFPLMFKESGKFGKVANSLPFFGSNGGIIVDQKLPDEERLLIWKELLEEGTRLIKENGCAASTFITTPFEKNPGWYDEYFDADFLDSRIGQITSLPQNEGDIQEALMNSFHQKTRNMIRKALKSDFSVRIDNSPEALSFLHEIHQENIASLGGIPKEKSFFDSIPKCFSNAEYAVYQAHLNGDIAASLLLLFFNGTVEYFTPAVKAEYRSLQPISLLIFQAMQDAVAKGAEYWNWGGTWHSQEGVYRFKKRWNAVDMPYKYYTRIYDSSLLQAEKNELLREFPYFYVLPFDKVLQK